MKPSGDAHQRTSILYCDDSCKVNSSYFNFVAHLALVEALLEATLKACIRDETDLLTTTLSGAAVEL